MIVSTYADALSRLLKDEGGYTDHPRDPGGPTNYGITIIDARKYWKPDATAADVKAMPVGVATEIYREQYAKPISYNDLPAGVDYAVFDYAVNSGIGRAPRVLQRIVEVEDDGEIGPDTLAAVRARDPKVIVNAICDERLTYLRGLKTFPTFGKGWTARVERVRAAAVKMAATRQDVVPIVVPKPEVDVPPWVSRMNAILGLYEFSGDKDNPAILAMAKACGGNIAKTYKHDSIPWCALTINYVLKASGFPGNDSLWALDFAKYGVKLSGPAVGAIATKTRSGGGHVFLVVGKTASGKLVGRGGNQSDMVNDELYDPADIMAYTWPKTWPLPVHVGTGVLPVVKPATKERRLVTLPPPASAPTPGKGVPKAPNTTAPATLPPAAGTATGYWLWDWVVAHPWETGIAAVVILFGTAMLVEEIKRRWRKRQEAPTSGLVPVS